MKRRIRYAIKVQRVVNERKLTLSVSSKRDDE